MTTNPLALDLLKLAEHYLSALHGSVARHDNLGLNLSCGGCALRDEIRAVLPTLADAVPGPPATRAAVLREAADDFEERCPEMNGGLPVCMCPAADELRRMADEEQQPEPRQSCACGQDGCEYCDVDEVDEEQQPAAETPRRGDAFEAWLKAHRDAAQDNPESWNVIDGVLDHYRLHADTGTPLGEHVCEGRVAGDCECLEQPAAVAQPGKEA